MAPRNFMSPAFLLRFPCKSLQGPPISSLGPTKSLPPSTTKAKPGSTPSGPLATRTCSRFRPTLPAKSPPPTPARPRSPPTSMASSPIFRSRLLLITLQITPGAATLLVGDSRQFTVVDERGKPSPIATWSVDNQGLASVTTDPSTTLTALAAGTVNLSATVEGVSMQIPVTISGATSFAPGTVLWSAPSAPGYTPQGLFQAVPNGHWPKSLFRPGRHRCYTNTCASLYFRWPAALANLAEFRLCGPVRPRWLWRHDRLDRLRRPQLHPAHPQRHQSPGRFQLVGANHFLHGRLRQRHLLRLPHAVSNLVRRGFATAPRGGETRSRLVYNPRHRSPGVRPSPAKYSFSSRRGRSWHALGFKFSRMSKLLGPGDVSPVYDARPPLPP